MPNLTNVNVTSEAFEYYWDITSSGRGCVVEVMNRHWCFGKSSQPEEESQCDSEECRRVDISSFHRDSNYH